MPDALVGGTSMSGFGVYTPASEIAFSYAIVYVTSVGFGREFDDPSNFRLFQVGYFSVGLLGPSADPHGTQYYWGSPHWIEWSQHIFPDSMTLTFTQEYYCDKLHYVMLGGATADINFFHV